MIDIPTFSEGEIKAHLNGRPFSTPDEMSLFYLSLCKHGGVRAIDIDGVIAETSTNYAKAKVMSSIPPDKYKYTVLYTARLSVDREVTEKWLKDHNIQYDALITNKLPYNILIDDKTSTKWKI